MTGPDREKIAGPGGATRQQLRGATAKPKAGRPKHFVFCVQTADEAVQPEARCARGRVSRDEVIEALDQIFRELRKAEAE